MGRLKSTGVQYTVERLEFTSIQQGNWCYFKLMLGFCERLSYFRMYPYFGIGLLCVGFTIYTMRSTIALKCKEQVCF